MTKFKQLSYLALSLFIIASSTPEQANAWNPFKKKKEKPPVAIENDPGKALFAPTQTPEQIQKAMDTLRELSNQMTPKIEDIKSKIEDGKHREAIDAAKDLLDNVRVKSGIDPKAKLQENIKVSVNFPAEAKNMASLSETQTITVIKDIQDHLGGLFMDVINLRKKVTLLYGMASYNYANNINPNRFSSDVREKIYDDLVFASIFPVPVVDLQGKTLTVFADEITTEDHSFWFNQDIIRFIESTPNLAINTAEFKNRCSETKRRLRGEPDPLTAEQTQAVLCMTNASIINNRRNKVEAQVSCIEQYMQNTASVANFCLSLASQIFYGTIYDNEYDSKVMRNGEEPFAKDYAQKVCFDGEHKKKENNQL